MRGFIKESKPSAESDTATQPTFERAEEPHPAAKPEQDTGPYARYLNVKEGSSQLGPNGLLEEITPLSDRGSLVRLRDPETGHLDTIIRVHPNGREANTYQLDSNGNLAGFIIRGDKGGTASVAGSGHWVFHDEFSKGPQPVNEIVFNQNTGTVTVDTPAGKRVFEPMYPFNPE